MSGASSIQWTDATWNPTRGCSVVSEGCHNCYAVPQAHRFNKPGLAYDGLTKVTSVGPRWSGVVRPIPEQLDWPLGYRGHKDAIAEGRSTRIFVNSMSDLFHESLDVRFIAEVWAVMSMAPRHTFQILTKRARLMRATLTMPHFKLEVNAARLRRGVSVLPDSKRPDGTYAWPLPNVWLGVSAENQARADERIPDLLATPAAIRFVSAEPLLGPIDFLQIAERHGSPVACCDRPGCERCDGTGESHSMGIHWVIVGGESGHEARPCRPDWINSILTQCADAGIAAFYKQGGAWRQPLPGEEYDTSTGRAGHPPAFIVAEDGTVHCFHSDRTTNGMTMVMSRGKNDDPAAWPPAMRVRQMPGEAA